MPGSVASSSDDEVCFQQAYHWSDTLFNTVSRTRASSWTSTSSNRMVIWSRCTSMRFAYSSRHQPVRHLEVEERRLLHCCGCPRSAQQTPSQDSRLLRDQGREGQGGCQEEFAEWRRIHDQRRPCTREKALLPDLYWQPTVGFDSQRGLPVVQHQRGLRRVPSVLPASLSLISP
jgi:hypothetical protein